MLRPSSLRGCVLRFVVENDGEVDAARIAGHLLPPPAFRAPAAGATFADRSAALKARLGELAAHRAESTRQVSRALDWLQAHGLVARCGRPEVAAWFEARVARHGLLPALERAHPAWPHNVAGLGTHAALVEKCRQGPSSVAELVGTNPSGARKRAWREVCAWGVVLAPGGRRATPAGIALVEQHRRAA